MNLDPDCLGGMQLTGLVSIFSPPCLLHLETERQSLKGTSGQGTGKGGERSCEGGEKELRHPRKTDPVKMEIGKPPAQP